MKLRFIHIRTALAMLVAVLSCRGADSLAPSTSDSTLLSGLYASGPVASASDASNSVSGNASVDPSVEVSWVSLVPGTVPDGSAAKIVNRRTARSLTTVIVDGGFDPQPISASLGDTIQVIVSRVGKPDAAAVLSVVPRPAPRLVRSTPPRGQTDVPLNMVITLVFSEPLDAASVNPTSITLTAAGSSPVAGAVRVVPGPGYAVEFAPAAPLAPSTRYALTVRDVVNLAGTPLAAPTSTSFTTSATAPTTIVPRGQAAREILVNSHFLAFGPWEAGTGNALPTVWRSRDPSIATATSWGNSQTDGEVVGIRPGTTIVEGTTQGGTVTISVTVLAPAPAAAASPVVVDFRMLELQSAPAGSNSWFYAPELVVRDTTGRGGTAVIALSVDLPGMGIPPTCHMLRPVGSSPTEVFHESYGDFELTYDAGGGARASGTEAVAHITLRIPGPAAMIIDVPGPIVPGSMPTTYTGGYSADVLSCG